MRVALIAEHASPLAVLGTGGAGGQNVYIAGLAMALAERGHEVDVYTRRDAWQLPARRELAPGVTVVHVTAGGARPANGDERSQSVPAFARRLIRDWSAGPRPDVVHAHRWRSGAAAVIAARAVGVPVVQSFHGLSSTGNGSCPPEQAPTEADLLQAVEHVVATRVDEVPELISGGLLDGNLTLATGGVDTERFAPDGETWPRGRRRRLLYLGQLVEHKGIDTVVQALPDLPDTELLIAGGPPAAGVRIDGEAQRLTRLAADLEVGGRVQLTGSVKHETVPALLRSADVVVSTPRHEPARLTPLEAMSCAKPIVCSELSGASGVEDGTTGLFVRPDDPAAVAVAVRRFFEDAVLAERIGAAGRRVASGYDWKQVAARVEDAYGAAAERRAVA